MEMKYKEQFIQNWTNAQIAEDAKDRWEALIGIIKKNS